MDSIQRVQNDAKNANALSGFCVNAYFHPIKSKFPCLRPNYQFLHLERPRTIHIFNRRNSVHNWMPFFWSSRVLTTKYMFLITFVDDFYPWIRKIKLKIRFFSEIALKLSKSPYFFNISKKFSLLNRTLGLRKSFLNQTTYVLKNWL